ncbi:hypothetical protein D3C81_1922630 [compost metagenome]
MRTPAALVAMFNIAAFIAPCRSIRRSTLRRRLSMSLRRPLKLSVRLLILLSV